MKMVIVIGALITLAIFSAGAGQPDVEDFTRLGESIKRLDPIVPRISFWREQAVPLWNEMDKCRIDLQEFAQEHTMPDQYRQEITKISFIFDTFEKQSQNTSFWGVYGTNFIEVCPVTDENLRSKAKHAKLHPTEPFGAIRVSVRTLSNENEVSGFEVWYVPIAWEGEKSRFQCYKKHSSPTAQNLYPGCYKMWSQKGDRSGKKIPVTVQDDKPGPVDLPTPQE